MMETKKDSIIKYYPSPITMEKNKIITKQMEKCICKIKINNNEGIGFFCEIPHQNQKIYTLITNNNILNEGTIKEHKTINVTLNDEKENINIEINENNNIYINTEYNITIIEINQKIVNNNFYLELDQIILNSNLNLSNEPIYILHYPKCNDCRMASVSYGILEKNDNLNFNFYCNIGLDSIGSPILNLSNNKLIGIFKESNELNYNTGIILKNIIEEFLKNRKILNQNLDENKNENHNTALPDIKKTILGPETAEDEEDLEEMSNQKDIKDSVDIKKTILGPEAYDDDEEEKIEQNINITSNKLENNNINNNLTNEANNIDNLKNENINNNKNLNNIFNCNSDYKKETKIKDFENINKELNKKSSNSDHNNNCINMISKNLNQENHNINYYSNKQINNINLNRESNNNINGFSVNQFNNVNNNNQNYFSNNQINNISLNKESNNNINNFGINQFNNFNNNNQNYFSNKQINNMNLDNGSNNNRNDFINNQINNVNNNNQNFSSNKQNNKMNLNKDSNNNINDFCNNQINNINNNNININTMKLGNNQINSMDKMHLLNDNKNNLSISQFSHNSNIKVDINSMNKTSYTPNFSFSMYKNVPRTGLKDLGNTSYLNSTLHLLGNFNKLVSFFLNPINVINPNVSLSFFIQRLFRHFYPYPENDKPEIYEPKHILGFLNTLGNFDNPNSLIKIILDTLHCELNVFNKNMIKKNPNKFNKKEVIKAEIDNFQNFNNSKIYHIFNWFELKESLCYNCNCTSYELNTNNIFNLDIFKTYNFYKKNFITIYDCLAFGKLPKQEKYYCENCKNCKNKLNTSKIYISPNVFIFSLDRGNMDQNLLNVRYLVEEKINLVEHIETKESPHFYELNGIVSIYVNQRKYVSCCKSPIDQQWYYYENENVQIVNFNNMINNHNNNNFIPCLLVYNKSNKQC